MLDMSADTAGDIIGGAVADWLVVGWFTPDYRPLAERFARELYEAANTPHHLFAKEKLATGWNTSRKPSVVLVAMDLYPGKTIILMDADCMVRGSLAPMLAGIDGDVDITITALEAPKGTVTARSSVRLRLPRSPLRSALGVAHGDRKVRSQGTRAQWWW